MKGLYIHSLMFGTTGPAIHGKEFVKAMNKLGVKLDIFPPVIKPYYLFQRIRDSKKLSRLKNWRACLSFIEPYIGIVLGFKKWIDLFHGKYDFMIVRNTDFSIHLFGNIKVPENLPLILEINSFMSEKLTSKDRSISSYNKTLQEREISLIKKAYTIFVVSEKLISNLLEIGIPKRKISVIPNGVDPEVFHSKISGERIRLKYGLKDKIVVGFLGEVRQGHDMETLVKGFSISSDLKKDMILFIVGPDKDFFNNIIEKQNIRSKVVITGRIEYKYVPEYLAAFDIAISPIRYLSLSPIKNYEYMAMGKAIIATDLGKETEMLKNGESAILIKPGAPEEMAEAILKLADDSNLRNKMGNLARKIVIANFTWQHNAQRVIDLIQKVK